MMARPDKTPVDGGRDYTDRQQLRDDILKRWTYLKAERAPFLPQWLEISRHITPSSGRFLQDDVKNTARDRWNHIYDNAATYAATILSSGLQTGMCDPSTQWFSLTTGTPELDESHEVKTYLDYVQRILEMAFERSNVYQALHHGWREVGVYGTSAAIMTEDPRDGLHMYPLSCGEYCIGVDNRNNPDTIYRRFSMTASQMVGRYGRKVVSKSVIQNYDNGNRDKLYKCIHAIEPRRIRERGKRDNLNMPWRSVVMQIDCDDGTQGILEESGFEEFPGIVGRWGTSATDVYSEESPGMVALGDTLQLQHEQLQKGNAIDYQVDPPIILPASARNSEIDFLPGGRSFVDMPNTGSQVQNAWAAKFDLGEVVRDMQEVRQRINQAFHVDMFLMVSQQTRHQMTAEEVARRNEEKLMMLGPVLSRLNNEILKSVIERAFSVLNRLGQMPPPPPELQGKSLNVHYMSMLSRAQRSLRSNSMDSFLSRIGQIAQFKPEVLEKIDGFAMVDAYADYFSISPSVIKPTEEAQAAVEAQQQAQAQQQQMQGQLNAASAISKLGNVPADKSTVGGQLASGLQQAALGAQGGGLPEMAGYGSEEM